MCGDNYININMYFYVLYINFLKSHTAGYSPKKRKIKLFDELLFSHIRFFYKKRYIKQNFQSEEHLTLYLYIFQGYELKPTLNLIS